MTEMPIGYFLLVIVIVLFGALWLAERGQYLLYRAYDRWRYHRRQLPYTGRTESLEDKE